MALFVLFGSDFIVLVVLDLYDTRFRSDYQCSSDVNVARFIFLSFMLIFFKFNYYDL